MNMQPPNLIESFNGLQRTIAIMPKAEGLHRDGFRIFQT